jgi:low molecular weight protein-tyrosine phosphatase
VHRVCFVCLGNICRSPAAEAVMRRVVDDAGLSSLVEVDSAGTARYHIGARSDARARAEGARRGLVMDHRARQFEAGELSRWDLVVAMDRQNLRDLQRLARTEDEAARIRLVREFDPDASAGDLDVPDPYYAGDEAFAAVFDVLEPACRGLLAHLVATPVADGQGRSR